jgi:hypothetical protein
MAPVGRGTEAACPGLWVAAVAEDEGPEADRLRSPAVTVFTTVACSSIKLADATSLALTVLTSDLASVPHAWPVAMMVQVISAVVVAPDQLQLASIIQSAGVRGSTAWKLQWSDACTIV